MELFTLYAYRNTDELRKIQQKHEVYDFIFGETKDLLEYDSNCCIDITSLIYYLKAKQEDLLPARVNFNDISEETIVIVDEKLIEDALHYFPNLFGNYDHFFNDVEEEKSKKIEEYKFQPIKREIAYTYNDLEDINVILDYANKNEIPITTISNASNFRQELSKFNKEKELVLIDLTSILYAIEDNKSLIYTIEMILNLYENKKVIVLTSKYDVLVKYFPLYFAEQKSIRELFPKIEGLSEPKDDKIKVKKITNLTNEEYATFTSFFMTI